MLDVRPYHVVPFDEAKIAVSFDRAPLLAGDAGVEHPLELDPRRGVGHDVTRHPDRLTRRHAVHFLLVRHTVRLVCGKKERDGKKLLQIVLRTNKVDKSKFADESTVNSLQYFLQIF